MEITKKEQRALRYVLSSILFLALFFGIGVFYPIVLFKTIIALQVLAVLIVVIKGIQLAWFTKPVDEGKSPS